MCTSTRARGLLLAAMALMPLTLQAEESEVKRGPWVWNLAGGAVHQFESDLKDEEGQFSVSRGFLQGGLGYAWNRRTSVSLSFGAGVSNYDFSSEATIEGEQPWEQIEDYRVSLPVRFSPTERTDVIIIPSLRSYKEADATLSDGRTEGALAGISWRINDSLSIGPGFGWFTQLGGGSEAFPILVIDWKITEKLRLNTGSGLAASQGPGLTLSYALTDSWNIGLSGRYERTRFALEDRPGRSGGFGQEKSLPLVLQATWAPDPGLSFSVLAGAEFEGSLRLEDDQGERLARSEFDVAPVAGLAFSARF